MKLPQDKVKHFVVGAFVSSIFVCITIFFPNVTPYLGVFMAALVGAIKEVIDDHGPGHEEFMDFFATMAGGFVPTLAYIAITHYL